jgi:hypothetical protein
VTRAQKARLIRLETRPVRFTGPVFSFAAPPPWWEIMDVVCSTPEAGMKALLDAMTDGDLWMVCRAMVCQAKHEDGTLGPDWESETEKIMDRMVDAARREKLFGAKTR